MKNTTTLFFLGLIGIWLWSSCNSESPSQLVIYPTIDYDAVYVAEEEPGDYIQILLKMSLKNYQGDILKLGLSSPEQHQERLLYFIQGFKSDIDLVTNQDTLFCVDAHFERLHMDLPYRNFILTFKHSDFTTSDHLLINDQVYSNQQLRLKIHKNHEN